MHGLEPHLTHQPLHAFAMDPMPALPKFLTQTPTTIKRPLQIERIERAHHGKVCA